MAPPKKKKAEASIDLTKKDFDRYAMCFAKEKDDAYHRLLKSDFTSDKDAYGYIKTLPAAVQRNHNLVIVGYYIGEVQGGYIIPKTSR